MLKKGCLAAGKSEMEIVEVPDEIKALSAVLEEAKPGDTVVIFFEKLKPVLELLSGWAVHRGADKTPAGAPVAAAE